MPKLKDVLVLYKFDEDMKKRLVEMNPDANYVYAKPAEVTREQLEKAEIILGSLAPDKVEGLENLKWMQLWSAGSDAFHRNGKFPSGAILTNGSGGYGLTIAEYITGTLLMLMRKLDRAYKNQLECKWEKVGAITSIYGSRILIVGLGNLGGEFGVRAKALGAHITGVRRSNDKPKPDFADEVYTADKLDELLPLADVVVLSVPDTGETQKLMSKERIAKLKKGSILINVGRGTAVDTNALADALENGDIYGAALDVTDPEPLPADHRLWKAPNIIITPHISGGHELPETYRRLCEIALANYDAFVNDKPMKNVVDFKKGY